MPTRRGRTTHTEDMLPFEADQRALDISAIHWATAIYTQPPEVEALLDRLEWPLRGRHLLDPGAGNGAFVVAALARLPLVRNDVEGAVDWVKGFEFEPAAAYEARRGVAALLMDRDWDQAQAFRAAEGVIEIRDYLLDPVPSGYFDVIAANPPYWRRSNLPTEYGEEFDQKVEKRAQGDLLFAYLAKSAEVIAPDGRIGVITSDRWLLNTQAGGLRAMMGEKFTVEDVIKLEHDSTFYRSKERRKGTLARVHPVSMILTPERHGRKLTRDIFTIKEMPHIDGHRFSSLVKMQLAPYMGPKGVFLVSDPTKFPPEWLAPVVKPKDINRDTGAVATPNLWALVVDHREPPPVVLDHLLRNRHLMTDRGLHGTPWLPPESFAHRLPLNHDAVLVPRISKRLRGVLLPAGRLPIDHNLVVVSEPGPEATLRMLDDPQVQWQAEQLTVGVDGDYFSYTTTLLKRLVVPIELVRDLQRSHGLVVPDFANNGFGDFESPTTSASNLGFSL